MNIDNVVEIVRRASGLMVQNGFEVIQKDGPVNVVTSSDLAVQHFLVRELGALLPGCGFLCEEEDFSDISEEYVWIIDPIDGTMNYARGIADCCICVALAHNTPGGMDLVAGVVYSPWRGQLWTAEKGKGAFLNGKPIHVSDKPLEEGIFCSAMSTYRKDLAATCSKIIFDVYMQSNDLRRYGSAALELCLLATGYVDLYFEIRLQPWDYAAATLIIREAGGFISSFDGKEPSLSRTSLVIAANTRENLDVISASVHRHLDAIPY